MTGGRDPVRAVWRRLPPSAKHVIRRGRDLLERTPDPPVMMQPGPFPEVRFRMGTLRGRDQIATAISAGGWKAFEPPLPDVFAAVVRRYHGGLVLDVGANSGFYSLLAVAASSHCEVHAFEPLPEARRALDHNLRLNPRLRPRVRIFAAAVADRAGTAALHLPDASHGLLETSASLNPAFKGLVASRLNVPLITLDDHMASRPSLSLRVIKIDVESMEHLVLAGARQAIERHRPSIFVEVLPAGDADSLEAFCSNLGYVPIRLDPTSASVVERIAHDSGGWNQMLVPREQLVSWLDVLRNVVPVSAEGL